jgi:hypothetical protein
MDCERGLRKEKYLVFGMGIGWGTSRVLQRC